MRLALYKSQPMKTLFTLSFLALVLTSSAFAAATPVKATPAQDAKVAKMYGQCPDSSLSYRYMRSNGKASDAMKEAAIIVLSQVVEGNCKTFNLVLEAIVSQRQ